MRIFLRGTVGGDQLTAQQIIVELDLFSGRPNPRWQLDERTSTELRQLQARLHVSLRVPAEPLALGYRGFLYTDATETCRAYKGFIRTSHSVLDDPELTIERFLLDILPAEYASLASRVASELARPG